MAYLNDKDNESFVLNLVNDSVIAHPDPVKLIFSLHLDAVYRSRVGFKRIKSFAQPLVKFLIGQRTQKFFCGTANLNRVAHPIRA